MYYVDASEEVRRELKQLHQDALKQGRGKAFVSSLRAMYERLHHDPFEFGEPLYSLPMLRLQVRNAAIRPLAVMYSVSTEHPIVIVKKLHLMG